MTKKFFFSSVLIFMLVLLSACSSLTAVAAPAVDTTGAAAATKASIVDDLGIGIIKLEDSAMQVSADQANNMLLLWKGVKLLSNDKSASTIELAALYEQIQENLTADQVAAIRQISWTQQEIDVVMQKYSSLVDTTSVVKKTTTLSSGGGGGDMGPGGGMGGPSGEMGVISGTTGSSSSSSTSTSTQAKIIAASSSKTSAVAGLNAQLADTLIALLKQRAGL